MIPHTQVTSSELRSPDHVMAVGTDRHLSRLRAAVTTVTVTARATVWGWV